MLVSSDLTARQTTISTPKNKSILPLIHTLSNIRLDSSGQSCPVQALFSRHQTFFISRSRMRRGSKPAAPWTFLGDINLKDANQLRRVSILVLEQLSHAKFLKHPLQESILQPCELTTIQKQRVASMMVGLKVEENNLLREVTIWCA